MNKLDSMSDDQVIDWIKKKIIIICLVVVTIMIIIYSAIINLLNPSLLDNFMLIAIVIYMITILSLRFFVNKLIFNKNNPHKAERAKNIRSRYRKNKKDI